MTTNGTTPATSAPVSQTVKCRTTLIVDNPVDVDEFGPHQRIADAIYDLIQNETGGVAIGIEGDWGSGKSTVVKLLESRLDHDPTRLLTLITFNAWAHEGDPLRRTFLESLIQHMMITMPWIDKVKWQEQLDIISRKKEIRSTLTDPQLTRLGKIMGFSLILFPLGTALLGAALRRDPQFSLNFDLYLTLYFFIGMLFTLGPVWLYIFFRLAPESIQEYLVPPHTSGNTNVGKFPIEHVLLNRSVSTEERTITTKTPDPTAIEFEETFKDLMNDALNNPRDVHSSKRHIVLVLDNLDRVAVSDALSIWSTLQTFLKHRQVTQSQWFERVWIIVPYDRNGLSLLWKKDNAGAGETAASFMDKSFQIRFEVPEPVRSEWRSFLVGKLKHALPDHANNKEELHTVYRVMAIYLARQNKIPTIRELKLYVNQIGAIHRQWCPKIPLTHIAYFVMLRRPSDTRVEGEDIISALLNKHIEFANPSGSQFRDFPEEDILDLLDESVENVRASMSALSFNVEPDIAQQLLLKDPVINALSLPGFENPTTDLEARDQGIQTLQGLAAFKGFWEVMETIINDEWTKGEADKVARAACCLKTSGLLQQENTEMYSSIVRALKRMAYKAMWPPLSPVKSAGMSALFAIVNEAPYSNLLLTKITTNLVDTDLDPSNLQVRSWAKELSAVKGELTSLGHGDAFRKGVLEVLGEQLRKPKLLDDVKHRVHMEALLEFGRTDSEAQSVLDDLAKRGDISRQGTSVPLRTANGVAWTILALLRHHRQGLIEIKADHPLSVRLAQMPIQIKDELVPLLVRYREVSSLFELLNDDNPLQRFALLVLGGLVDYDDLSAPDQIGYHLDPGLVLDNWTFLEMQLWVDLSDDVNRENFKRFIEFLVSRTDLIGEIAKSEFNEKHIQQYRQLYERGNKPDKLRSFLINKLETVTESEWREQLVTNGHFLELALQISRADGDGRALLQREDFQLALADYATDVARGESPSLLPNDVTMILGKDSENTRTLRKQLSRIVLENGANVSAEFLEQFSTDLNDTVALSENQSEALACFKTFLTTRNVAGLKWMSNINDFSWLSPNSIKSLVQSVRRAVSGEKDDAAYPYLFILADTLSRSGPDTAAANLITLDEVDRIAARYQLVARKILQMPGVDGLHILRRMRSAKGYYSMTEFISETEAGLVSLEPFTGPIQSELGLIETATQLSRAKAFQLVTRLDSLLRKLIAEAELKATEDPPAE